LAANTEKNPVFFYILKQSAKTSTQFIIDDQNVATIIEIETHWFDWISNVINHSFSFP
jgi:hypothetical protein